MSDNTRQNEVLQKVEDRIRYCFRTGGKDLDLSHINLRYSFEVEVFASIVQTCPKLRSLTLYRTQLNDIGLQALAEQVQFLSQLQSLDLRRTQITNASLQTLAEQAPYLPQLKILNLGHTKITNTGIQTLATQAENLPQLQKLFLHRTKTFLPESLIDSADAQEIFRFLQQQQQPDAHPLREIKLLLLGRGDVGKTHLQKRLFDDDHPDINYYNPHQSRTHDIAFYQWPPKNAPDRPAQNTTCRVWDFGGQDHLHGSHRFFLGADHALYLLLLDATKSATQNRLDYWLRFLAHHGRSLRTDNQGNPLRAPVLILLNKCDTLTLAQASDRPPEIDADSAL